MKTSNLLLVLMTSTGLSLAGAEDKRDADYSGPFFA